MNRSTPKALRMRTVAAAATLMVVALGVSACGDGVSSAKNDGVLNVAIVSGPDTLDPIMSTEERTQFRFGLYGVYDRLFSVGANGELKGELVTDWEYAADGLSLTLTLRDDVEFRDGTPLDAQVVKTNLDRAITTESPVTQARLVDVAGVEIVDDYAVTVKLKRPTTNIPFVLALNAGLMVNPELLKSGDPGTETDGSGPYVVDEWVPGEKLVLKKDAEGYWNPDVVQADTIESTIIADLSARNNALLGGQVDVVEYWAGQQGSVEGRDGISCITAKAGSSIEIYLNREAGPLAKLEVRQALNFALDRDAIAKSLVGGSPAKWQLAREGLPGYSSDLEGMYSYDPAHARDLLTQAGYPDGFDLGPMLVSSAMASGVDAVVQEQLAAVGISVQPETVDAATLVTQFGDKQVQVALQFRATGSNPVEGMRNNWLLSHRNPNGVTSEFTQLLEAVDDNRLADDEREAKLFEINNYLMTQAWGVPVAWLDFKNCQSAPVTGLDEDDDYMTTFGLTDYRGIGLGAE